MPFKSAKQKNWMFANKPGMAKKWEKDSLSEDKSEPKNMPMDEMEIPKKKKKKMKDMLS